MKTFDEILDGQNIIRYRDHFKKAMKEAAEQAIERCAEVADASIQKIFTSENTQQDFANC